MLCKEIINVIEAAYPKSAALEGDNVGLQAGRAEKEVSKVYLALDATDKVVEAVLKAGADMLVTHHPLIYSPLKSVTDEGFISRRVLKLIQKDISYYVMHTNYDVIGMARLSSDLLNLKDCDVLDVTSPADAEPEGIGRIGTLGHPMTLEECCLFVKRQLKLGSVKVFGEMDRKIMRLAVSPGSGKDAILPAIQKGADALVTGDIGHHPGLDAVEQGLSVIDAGHYGTEYIFMDDMKVFLEKKLPCLNVQTAPVIHPFQIL